jgi:hypothetical protein
MDVTVESKIGRSSSLIADLYLFLSDFRNIAMMVPAEHAAKIQATEDRCIIDAPGAGNMELEYLEKQQPVLLKMGMAGGGDSLYLWIQLKEAAAYDTRIKITVRAKANIATKWIVKKQLQKFVDTMCDALCSIPAGFAPGGRYN